MCEGVGLGSTGTASGLGDQKWREVLDQHDMLTGREIENFGGRLVKSTGDGVLATLHTGEIERRGDDVGGIAVHIGARVSSKAEAGQVLVSRTVTDLVAGSGFEFEDKGEHALKGVPGTWQLFAVGA